MPHPHAVGALDKESNGVVFIKPGSYGEDPECQAVAQNIGPTVNDTFIYRFSPNYSDDTVVYSATRTAVVVNVKAKKAFYAGSGLSTDDYMLGICFLDPQENLFVVAKSIDEGGSGREDYLSIAKLEDQKLVETDMVMKLGETHHVSSNFPTHNTWIVHDRKLFVYNLGQMSCTDGSGEVRHPFSEIFNSNSNRIGYVKGFAIHPKQPFGVIIDEYTFGAHELTLVRWDIANPKKKDEQVLSFSHDLEPLKPLFGMDTMELAYQSFSPDGNWYVVGCVAPDAPENPYFVAIPVVPVDKKHPDFLDPDGLVVLGQVEGIASVAWMYEPVSYVVSDGQLLHKWDLDELPRVRAFEMPDGEGKKKRSILGKVGRLFGGGA
ncbi:MAG: hypothetical protein LBH93_04810 [Chitinispirillales bacterium]|nr:hypothetical protein [Chitinispirillales bacterium]